MSPRCRRRCPRPGRWVPEVRIRADEEGVPMLGAVLRYGQLVAPLQQAWLRAVQQSPQRLASRFGTAVTALKPLTDGVELDAGIAERFDLGVVAEGGVFAQQARKALTHDYGQTPGSVRPCCAAAHPAWRWNASRGTARWPCCRCAMPRQPPASAAPRWCGACLPATIRCVSSVPRSVRQCSTPWCRTWPGESAGFHL